jgi:hypothetical protein
MYNNSPALYYNNPLNQANMYNNSAALYYNNPLNQANMYNNSAALYYNNPLNQANMYNNSAALHYNNPLNQTGMYNGRPGLTYNNPLTQAGMYNGAGGLFYNNPTNQNSLITGYVPGTMGLGNQAVPGSIAGGAGGNNLNMQANQGAGRNQFGTNRSTVMRQNGLNGGFKRGPHKRRSRHLALQPIGRFGSREVSVIALRQNRFPTLWSRATKLASPRRPGTAGLVVDCAGTRGDGALGLPGDDVSFVQGSFRLS